MLGKGLTDLEEVGMEILETIGFLRNKEMGQKSEPTTQNSTRIRGSILGAWRVVAGI